MGSLGPVLMAPTSLAWIVVGASPCSMDLATLVSLLLVAPRRGLTFDLLQFLPCLLGLCVLNQISYVLILRNLNRAMQKYIKEKSEIFFSTLEVTVVNSLLCTSRILFSMLHNVCVWNWFIHYNIFSYMLQCIYSNKMRSYHTFSPITFSHNVSQTPFQVDQTLLAECCVCFFGSLPIFT